MRLIDADALMEYCNNLKGKTIDANDIARFPTVGGWISVKDRLPPEYSDCIVCADGYSQSAEYTKDGMFYTPDNYEAEKIKGVTHWMPLPEPPKEADNE